ncbi:hypothetical protein PRZ48_002924 [Zasmidium cellare]|uniref:Uncharacterized protein n=1 Tax=Zasmidium cellare TaxID=395010 RepID=A0ABR0ETM0_ZASCE|nr:hypothetical protein PRZ48_002924 [Zasmidium cellare]
MADGLREEMLRLQLNNRSDLASTSANHAAAAAAADFDAADYERDSDTDVGVAADTDPEDGDSGVPVLDLPLRPSQVGESGDVFFKRLDELVPPPDHGLTICTAGQNTRYYCLSFVDCEFDSAGMTTFAGCQYNFVSFEGCTFKGINHFVNSVGDQVSYKKCTFDDHWETNFEYRSGNEVVGRTFKNSRLDGDPAEANRKINMVEEQERELEYLSKHPRPPPGIHTVDDRGNDKSAGRGIVIKENRKHELYREVYFIDCIFNPDKPTVFDNCVLDGVTFKNCYFSGTRFQNFCAKGLKAINCSFTDCEYVNIERPPGEQLRGRTLNGSKNTGESVPEALIETLREKQGQKAWVLADEEDGNYTHKKAEPAKGIVIKDNVPLAPHQKKEDQPPPATAAKEEEQWDFATKGKGKGRAVEPGDEPVDESKKSGGTTPAAPATPDPPAEEAAPALAPTVFKTFNFEEDPETREETVVTDIADIPQAGNRRGPGFRYRHNPRLEPFYAIGRQMG